MKESCTVRLACFFDLTFLNIRFIRLTLKWRLWALAAKDLRATDKTVANSCKDGIIIL